MIIILSSQSILKKKEVQWKKYARIDSLLFLSFIHVEIVQSMSLLRNKSRLLSLGVYMKVGAGIKFDILTKTFFFHSLFISTPPPFPLLLYTLSVFWKFLSRFLWYHFLLISLCLFFFHTLSTNFVPHSFSMLHVSSRENLESRWRKHIKNSSNFKSCFAVLVMFRWKIKETWRYGRNPSFTPRVLSSPDKSRAQNGKEISSNNVIKNSEEDSTLF